MPFCSKCGAQISEEAQFCSKCGNPVNGKSTSGVDVPANKAVIRFSTNLGRQGGGFGAGWKLINADTKEEIIVAYGGEKITIDAPVNVALGHFFYKKFAFRIEAGKKYEAKLGPGAARATFIINEVDFFGAE